MKQQCTVHNLLCPIRYLFIQTISEVRKNVHANNQIVAQVNNLFQIAKAEIFIVETNYDKEHGSPK